MEHQEKSSWKKASMFLGVIAAVLAILADIVFVTWVFAKSDSIFSSFESFRVQTIEATNTQIKLNDKLMNQLDVMNQRGLKNEKRLNRLEKGHKYPPLEWDDVNVPNENK
jgi:hypothetical protein